MRVMVTVTVSDEARLHLGSGRKAKMKEVRAFLLEVCDHAVGQWESNRIASNRAEIESQIAALQEQLGVVEDLGPGAEIIEDAPPSSGHFPSAATPI